MTEEDRFLLLISDTAAYVEKRSAELDLNRPNEQLIVTIKREETPQVKVIIEQADSGTISGLKLQQKLGLSYNPEDLLRRVERRTHKDSTDGFSSRMYNVFQRMGAFDFFELVQASEQEVLVYQNAGPKSVAEANKFLEGFGLRLGMRIPQEVIEWCKSKR